MQICQELIDLGMTLARAATERALADMAAAPPQTPIPGSSAAAIEQAEERARHRTPDYGRLFTHLSRAVRQTILLQAHIADGRIHAQPAQGRSPTPDDRIPRPAQHTTPEADPHCESLRCEAAEHLDGTLAAAPHDDIAVEHLIEKIGRKFGKNLALANNPADTPPPAKTDRPEPTPPNRAPQPPSPGAHRTQTARRPDRRW